MKLYCNQIIVNLDQWLRRWPLKDIYMYYLELCWPFSSVEQNHLCNFIRRHHKEHFFEIILNLDKWFWRCCLKLFIIWSSGGPFVWQSLRLAE